MITILMDMDSTLNNWWEAVVAEVLRRGYGFDRANFKTWKTHDYIIGSDNPRELVSQICNDLSFWKNIPVMPGAQEVLKWMNAIYDITIVTSPWKDDDARYKKVKVDYIRENFGFLRKNPIIFNSKKWQIEGDVIFDDKPTVLENSFAEKITVKSIQPYNTEIESDFEYSSWANVPKIMKTIDKYFKENTGQK